MQIHRIHTDKKGKQYIIRESIFGNRKCYRKRGKGFHDYDNGIETEEQECTLNT